MIDRMIFLCNSWEINDFSQDIKKENNLAYETPNMIECIIIFFLLF